MTKYDELMDQLRHLLKSYEAFERRGKLAVATVFQEFAQYLEAPEGVCWVGPPGLPLDEDKRYPLHDFARLRPDGYFAGCMIVSDNKGPPPFGAVTRFTFYVRQHEKGYTLAWGDQEPQSPTSVETLDASALAPFFDRVFGQVKELAKSTPEKLAIGDAQRPIGFTAVF